jgi:hypothetical protein
MMRALQTAVVAAVPGLVFLMNSAHPADARGGHGLGAGLAATACTNRKSQAIIATATTPTPRPRRMNATSF